MCFTLLSKLTVVVVVVELGNFALYHQNAKTKFSYTNNSYCVSFIDSSMGNAVSVRSLALLVLKIHHFSNVKALIPLLEKFKLLVD